MADVDRRALRQRLIATQAAFHGLLDGITEDDLRRRSGNPAWSVGAVLSHLVWSLELLPREVAGARKGKGMYNFPPVVRDWLNAQLTRLGARGQTLQTLRQRYDAALAIALVTLDDVRDDEFRLGAHFWSEGFRDIEGLLAAQVDHLAEHEPDVRLVVPRLALAANAVETAAAVAVADQRAC
jgi:hypothetical protein